MVQVQGVTPGEPGHGSISLSIARKSSPLSSYRVAAHLPGNRPAALLPSERVRCRPAGALPCCMHYLLVAQVKLSSAQIKAPSTYAQLWLQPHNLVSQTSQVGSLWGVGSSAPAPTSAPPALLLPATWAVLATSRWSCSRSSWTQGCRWAVGQQHGQQQPQGPEIWQQCLRSVSHPRAAPSRCVIAAMVMEVRYIGIPTKAESTRTRPAL